MKTADQSAGMRWARWSAVVIIVIIGTAAFVLSFAALRDLAILANTPKQWAWLFPVIVDGTIIQATISALVLAASPERRWFLWVLGTGAMVSIAGNSLHAVAAGRILPWWASALVAAIAPISLLVDTHGLAVLFRAAQHDSAPVPDSAPQPVPEPVTEPATVPALQKAPARPAARRRAVSPRRDPAKVARAVSMRAEGKTYAEIGKALHVSPRTAANYASTAAPAATAAESRPLTAVAPAASVQSIHSSRPVQSMLPIAVPVGGN
ncbi:DUF2637 domain-containing protein [Nocardia sp. NPDC051321]|uniref:DUF2637 domain-containing protein n=1 Tax=Nocardia sp. NPDC051321 TaxID=3364323 RepID=UPI0037AF852D